MAPKLLQINKRLDGPTAQLGTSANRVATAKKRAFLSFRNSGQKITVSKITTIHPIRKSRSEVSGGPYSAKEAEIGVNNPVISIGKRNNAVKIKCNGCWVGLI